MQINLIELLKKANQVLVLATHDKTSYAEVNILSQHLAAAITGLEAQAKAQDKKAPSKGKRPVKKFKSK